MITLELSSHIVELKEALTYGDVEAINVAMLSGMKLKQSMKELSALKDKNINDVEFNAGAMIEAKHKGIERCITKITNKDGILVPYSNDWLENLTQEDGVKLELAVEEVKNSSGVKK